MDIFITKDTTIEQKKDMKLMWKKHLWCISFTTVFKTNVCAIKKGKRAKTDVNKKESLYYLQGWFLMK